jgi:hypothetical protein
MRRFRIGLLSLLVLAVGTLSVLPALAQQAPGAMAEQLAALNGILDRPEFHAADGRSALDRLLDPVRAWLRWVSLEIVRLLASILDPLGDAGGSAVVYGSIIAGLVVLAIVILMTLRLTRGSLTGNAEVTEFPRGGRPRATDERAQAQAYAQAGDPRRAIHHQYRAVLLRLDERDHLPFDGALTNRELVPRLTAAPALADPFAALVERFDRLWYGQTTCTAEEYAAFARLGDRVWQAAGTVPPAHFDRPPAAIGPSAPRGASSGAR